MISLTITIIKGGTGKTVLTANVAAYLAKKGKRVVVVDFKPTSQVDFLFKVKDDKNPTLADAIALDKPIENCFIKTHIDNLFLIRGGIPLYAFLDLNPFKFAEKLSKLDVDFLFIDSPTPESRIAYLSLGFVQYYILGPLAGNMNPLRFADDAIKTIELSIILNAKEIGFVINNVDDRMYTPEIISKLEELFQMPCLALIHKSDKVEGSFKDNPYLVIEKYPESEFSKAVEKIGEKILALTPAKKNPVEFLHSFIKIKD